ncbi:MAG: hypothetical protein IPK85_01795 [Gemmatimonadetes bacterium]|nr:hypothetical protein [Gemmatimonadota bacterium]
MAWSTTEMDVLRAALERHAMTLREAAALFPHRTRQAVYRQVYRAGLRSSHPRGYRPNQTRRT